MALRTPHLPVQVRSLTLALAVTAALFTVARAGSIHSETTADCALNDISISYVNTIQDPDVLFEDHALEALAEDVALFSVEAPCDDTQVEQLSHYLSLSYESATVEGDPFYYVLKVIDGELWRVCYPNEAIVVDDPTLKEPVLISFSRPTILR